jgi:hypothetical protein
MYENVHLIFTHLYLEITIFIRGKETVIKNDYYVRGLTMQFDKVLRVCLSEMNEDWLKNAH